MEIPSIKTFDRSAGVAGYYAAKRLKDAISVKAIDFGILIVPEKTKGDKFNLILKSNPNIHRVELNNEIGERLIANALKYPTEEGWNICKIIFKDIGEYVPKVEETQSDEEPIE
ncbi:MAG: hypothetical protein KAW03_03020, partial [Candidatus Lokiarchaeota archaeon]|nr:hypothetical protein [Candidatus Lokiarchaeota archaeon]